MRSFKKAVWPRGVPLFFSLSLEVFIGGECSLGCCEMVRPFREGPNTWSQSIGSSCGWKTNSTVHKYYSRKLCLRGIHEEVYQK